MSLLSNLGAELDALRRARTAVIHNDEDNKTELNISSRSLVKANQGDLHELQDNATNVDDNKEASGSLKIKKNKKPDVQEHSQEERPYPLCLLCLARPPSAVLLPCCHLNLCYICAPLLLYRASQTQTFRSAYSETTSFSLDTPPQYISRLTSTSTTSTSSTVRSPSLIPLSSGSSESSSASFSPFNSSSSSSESPNTSLQHSFLIATQSSEPEILATAPPPPRTPFNILLARATANHAPSRRFLNFGYIPPEMGTVGGELRGKDLIPCDKLMTIRKEHQMTGMKTISSWSEDDEVEIEKQMRIGLKVAFEDENGEVKTTSQNFQQLKEQTRERKVKRDLEKELVQNNTSNPSLRVKIQPAHGIGTDAKCLVCRGEVKAWLRVYTG